MIGLALAATVLAMVLGVASGLIAGYARAGVDEAIMRLLDVCLRFPRSSSSLLFVSILGPRSG